MQNINIYILLNLKKIILRLRDYKIKIIIRIRLRDLHYYKIIIRLYTHTNLKKIIDEKLHVARIYHTDDRCESQPYIIYKSDCPRSL